MQKANFGFIFCIINQNHGSISNNYYTSPNSLSDHLISRHLLHHLYLARHLAFYPAKDPCPPSWESTICHQHPSWDWQPNLFEVQADFGFHQPIDRSSGHRRSLWRLC